VNTVIPHWIKGKPEKRFFTKGKVLTTRWVDPEGRPERGLSFGFPENN
jgi:hypothetical protein